MSTAEEAEQPGVRELSVQLDADAKTVLDELIDREQHTTYLKKTTGLSRQALHRRLDSLEDLGVIATEKKQPAEGGQKRKHARLTDRGQELIDDGLIEGITDTNQNVETLADRLDELGRELRSELDRKPSRFDIRQVAESEAEEARDEFDRDLDKLREEIDIAKRIAERAKELAAEANEEDLSRTVSRLETRIKGLQGRVDHVQTQAEGCKARLDELEQGARRRDRQIGALLAHVSRLCIQADARDERIATAESHAAGAKRTARRQKDRVDETLDDVDETLDDALGTVNRNSRHTKKKIRGFDRRVNRLEDALEDATDLDKSIRECRSRIVDLSEECREVRSELREAKNDGGLFF